MMIVEITISTAIIRMLNLFANVLFFMTTKFYLSLRPSIWSEINCKYKHFPRNRQIKRLFSF